MARGVVLVDTGPLVALLCARERRHAWTREQFSRLQAPLLTCEAVLSEADHLVRRIGGDGAVVLELAQRGVVRIAMSLDEERAAVDRIQVKYRDVAASLADACLVRMSELFDENVLMTFDAHFRLYRRHGRRVITLLAPRD